MLDVRKNIKSSCLIYLHIFLKKLTVIFLFLISIVFSPIISSVDFSHVTSLFPLRGPNFPVTLKRSVSVSGGPANRYRHDPWKCIHAPSNVWICGSPAIRQQENVGSKEIYLQFELVCLFNTDNTL